MSHLVPTDREGVLTPRWRDLAVHQAQSIADLTAELALREKEVEVLRRNARHKPDDSLTTAARQTIATLDEGFKRIGALCAAHDIPWAPDATAEGPIEATLHALRSLIDELAIAGAALAADETEAIALLRHELAICHDELRAAEEAALPGITAAIHRAIAGAGLVDNLGVTPTAAAVAAITRLHQDLEAARRECKDLDMRLQIWGHTPGAKDLAHLRMELSDVQAQLEAERAKQAHGDRLAGLVEGGFPGPITREDGLRESLKESQAKRDDLERALAEQTRAYHAVVDQCERAKVRLREVEGLNEDLTFQLADAHKAIAENPEGQLDPVTKLPIVESLKIQCARYRDEGKHNAERVLAQEETIKRLHNAGNDVAASMRLAGFYDEGQELWDNLHTLIIGYTELTADYERMSGQVAALKASGASPETEAKIAELEGLTREINVKLRAVEADEAYLSERIEAIEAVSAWFRELGAVWDDEQGFLANIKAIVAGGQLARLGADQDRVRAYVIANTQQPWDNTTSFADNVLNVIQVLEAGVHRGREATQTLSAVGGAIDRIDPSLVWRAEGAIADNVSQAYRVLTDRVEATEEGIRRANAERDALKTEVSNLEINAEAQGRALKKYLPKAEAYDRAVADGKLPAAYEVFVAIECAMCGGSFPAQPSDGRTVCGPCLEDQVTEAPAKVTPDPEPKAAPEPKEPVRYGCATPTCENSVAAPGPCLACRARDTITAEAAARDKAIAAPDPVVEAVVPAVQAKRAPADNYKRVLDPRNCKRRDCQKPYTPVGRELVCPECRAADEKERALPPCLRCEQDFERKGSANQRICTPCRIADRENPKTTPLRDTPANAPTMASKPGAPAGPRRQSSGDPAVEKCGSCANARVNADAYTGFECLRNASACGPRGAALLHEPGTPAPSVTRR
jgi:hypothetical protein